MGLNFMSPPILRFLSIKIQWPVSRGFASMDSTNSGLQRVFSIHGWGSVDAERQLYALICAILYMGLEYPWILVSGGFLEPVLDTIDTFLGNQKLYMEEKKKSYTWTFNWMGVQCPNSCIVYGSAVYMCECVCVCVFFYSLKVNCKSKYLNIN